MDNQTFFNQCVQKLLEQGRPAMDDGVCLYRGPESTKCGIGHFIPDDEYNSEEMEGSGVRTIFTASPTLTKLVESVNLNLMASMQQCHDGGYSFYKPTDSNIFAARDFPKELEVDPRYDTHERWVEQFRKRAKLVGETYNLNTEICNG